PCPDQGDRNTLIPLSVRQLVKAEKQDDSFFVDGHELYSVELMGTLQGLSEHSTHMIFHLSDGSGVVECKQWIDKESSQQQVLRTIKEGAMVRVVGSLRDYEGQRHVLIYEVELTVDFNTLTHHLLQIMLTHLKHTKGPIPVCSVLCTLCSILRALTFSPTPNSGLSRCAGGLPQQ
ncbi:hypothetical protein B484DRAFT_333709, partial [Ochromonadaceae sp. CCMP2298]